MKKIFILALALGLVMSMAACGGGTEEEETETAETVQTAEEIMAASETDAAEHSATPPASSTDAAVDEAAYATAQEYIGRTVEELYTAIGEPTGGSQYAASCEGEEGAEDGMLFYEGFYIWSVRTEEQETVRAVYLTD